MLLILKYYKSVITVFLLLTPIFLTGCLTENNTDQWYTASGHGYFSWVNITNIIFTLDDNNIEYNYTDNNGDGKYFERLTFYISDNSSYMFDNITYNISATTFIIHNETKINGSIWLNILLSGGRFEKYRYQNPNKAIKNQNLLKPSKEILDHILEESGNIMPHNFQYSYI